MTPSNPTLCSHSTNVGDLERIASLAAGAFFLTSGCTRRDWKGVLFAGIGVALAYRGAVGHCQLYKTVGVDTASSTSRENFEKHGVHIRECFLIDKSPEELYSYWRNFERLPAFMSHLKSVHNLGNRRSEWTACTSIPGMKEVQWIAETVIDEPNKEIAWQTDADSWIQHRGSVMFAPALGNRGTNVRVHLEYLPPAGQAGLWIAQLFGDDPHNKVRDDLRTFKRLMETGQSSSAGRQQGAPVPSL